MKPLITIVLLFSLSGVQAQDIKQDSLSRIANGLDSIQAMSQLDSAAHKVSSKTDTLKQKLFHQKEKLNKWKSIGKGDTLTTGIQSKGDSLKNRLTSNGKPTAKLDSAKLIIRKRADSLSNLTISGDKYQRKVDSLSTKTTGFLDEKRQAVSDKLEEKGINSDVIEKTQLDLPGTELPEMDVPDIGLDKTLPEMPAPEVNTDLNLPDTDIPEVDPDIANPLDDELKFDSQVEGVKDIDVLESASEQMEQVGEVTGQVGEYQETLEKAKAGDLEGVDQRIEEGIGNIDEVQELQKNMGEFESLQSPENPMSDLEKLNDKEALKEELVEQSRKQVTDHLTDHAEKLQGAFELLAKYKKKYHSLESIKKLPKRRTSYLQEEPFLTRLLPGIGLEVSRKDIILVDLAPSFGYRITDQWSFYGSYLYRFHFNHDHESFDWNQLVYGPRATLAFTFLKGYLVQASADRLRTNVPVNTPVIESSRQWVNGVYLGLGKQVRFRKRVISNVSFNYNFLYKEQESPFPRKFNIRFVFDFELREKRIDRIRQKEKAITP